jgi:hypothetical protein
LLGLLAGCPVPDSGSVEMCRVPCLVDVAWVLLLVPLVVLE